MKTITIVIAVIGAIFLNGCSTTQHTTEPSATIQVTYEVFGMDCPGCHGGLEKNLVKIPGVLSAKANWQKKTVTLICDQTNPIDAELVSKAVKDSNFTIGKEIKQ